MAHPPLRYGSFLSQSFVVVFANLLTAALSLGYVALVSRSLGPAEYGNVTAAISLGNILLLLLGPLNSTLIKFTARYHREDDLAHLAGLAFDSLRRLSLPLGAAMAVVLLASPLLQRALRIDSLAVLLALALFAVLSILVAFPRAVLSGAQRFGAFGLNQVTEGLVRLIGGVAAVVLGLQAAGAMAAYTLGILIAFLFALFQVRHLLGVARAPIDTRALFSFSVPVIFVYAYMVLTTNLDMLVVKAALSDTDAGLYGAASTLARLLFLVATPIHLVLFSRVSAVKTADEGRRLSMQVLAVLAAGLIFSFAFPWLFGGWLLYLLFGAAYVGAEPLLRILWITTSLLILQVAATHYLLAVERLASAWIFLLPCLLLGILLYGFHGSADQVALCGLAAVTAGFVATVIFLWNAPNEPRAEPDAATSELVAAQSNISEVSR